MTDQLEAIIAQQNDILNDDTNEPIKVYQINGSGYIFSSLDRATDWINEKMVTEHAYQAEQYGKRYEPQTPHKETQDYFIYPSCQYSVVRRELDYANV